MQTYLFYDLETSGLSPSFDQVYQFAAIRTDLELNEIERYEFLVKPTRDVIPSPEAMITHRLSMDQLQQEGIPEHEAIFRIHQLLNTPGTISLGYNTLSFDDEFLRFNFYRHLLTPYTHQFANQCRRMDLFPMVVFYYLGRRDHLKWGMRDDNTVSLRLEHLAKENNLADGPAHNAMVDVEATVALAKQLRLDTKMWDNLLGCFVKNEEMTRLAKLPLVDVGGVGYPIGLAVNGKFGTAKFYQVSVLGLGQHRHYKNQTLWLNLEDERIVSGDPALIPKIWTVKKRLGEPPFIMQATSRFNLVDAERQKRVAETLQFLQQKPGYFKAIQDSALDFKFPVYPEVDQDAALYQLQFWTDIELTEMRAFWQAEPKEKAKQVRQFRNASLQGLALRQLGRFYPEVLDAEDQQAFTAYLAKIWQSEDCDIVDYQKQVRLTRSAALARIEAMDLSLLDTQQQAVLASVKRYLQA